MPPTALDPQAVSLAKAIRQTESGGNFQARGGSGEYGAYQFMPSTWSATAPKFGVSVPLEQATPEQQNQVAYSQIKEWKDQGLNVGQIASAWNAGYGRKDAYLTGNAGVNSKGVSYDTGAYAKKVAEAYQSFKTSAPTTGPAASVIADSGTAGAVTQGRPTYGATFAYDESDNGLVAGFKALGNLPSSAIGFGKGIVDMVLNPIETVTNVGNAAIGGVQKLTGDTDPNDQYSQTFDSLATALKERYGGLDELANTATNDPFGFGADIAGILAGGAGVAGKGAQLGNVGSRVAQTVAGPVTKAGNKALGSIVGGTDSTALAASKRAGAALGEEVAIPASGFTSNPVIQRIVATTAGNKLAEQISRSVDQLDVLAQKLVRDTGGFDDLGKAGEEITKALTKYEDGFKSASGKLYDAVTEKVGDISPSTNVSTGAIAKILEDKNIIGETSDVAFFKEKLNVLTGAEGTKPPTFSSLRKIRTALGEKIDKGFDDPFVRSNTRQLRDLYFALTKDIENTVRQASQVSGDATLLKEFQRANKIYAQGRKEIASGFARTIKRLGDEGQYSKLALDLIKPSTAAEDIPRIFSVLGEQGASQVRASFLQKILESARNAEGEFTPNGILREIKKYEKDGKLSVILDPRQEQALNDLGRLTKALGESQKLEKGSQTFFLLKTMGEFGLLTKAVWDFSTGNVVGGAQAFGAALAPEVAGMFIASKTGQRLIAAGIERGDEMRALASKEGLIFDDEGSIITPNDNGIPTGDSNGLRNTDSLGDAPGNSSFANESLQQGNKRKRRPVRDGVLSSTPLVELANAANFDLEGALEEGYSEEDILAYLEGTGI